MWSKKYRPKTLEECVLSHLTEKDRKLIETAASSKESYSLLFYGPAGTGKTTIAQIICDRDDVNYRHFNGSLLGKDDVANELRLATHPSLHSRQQCILIDEIDGFTKQGQLALRALMNEEKFNVSWVCTANDISSLVEPLQSRFMKIDCSYPTRNARQQHEDAIVQRCQSVLSQENNSNIPEDEIRRIVRDTCPDIRYALNELERRSLTKLAA